MEVIELESDIRLQDAHGLPGFLLSPGFGNGVQRFVPLWDDEMSNASLFLFRIKSPRLHGLLLTTPITLLSPSHAGEVVRMVFASFTASDITGVAGPKVWTQRILFGGDLSCGL